MGNLRPSSTGATLECVDRTRCGVLVGSAMGGLQVLEDNVLNLKTKGIKKVSPFTVPYMLTNMSGAILGMQPELGFRGPNYAINTACASSNYAIINAAMHIRAGQVGRGGGAEGGAFPVPRDCSTHRPPHLAWHRLTSGVEPLASPTQRDPAPAAEGRSPPPRTRRRRRMFRSRQRPPRTSTIIMPTHTRDAMNGRSKRNRMRRGTLGLVFVLFLSRVPTAS